MQAWFFPVSFAIARNAGMPIPITPPAIPNRAIPAAAPGSASDSSLCTIPRHAASDIRSACTILVSKDEEFVDGGP